MMWLILFSCPHKTEDYQIAPGKDSVHGYGGRLKVSYGGIFTNIGKDFLAVGEKYDPSRGSSEDPNDLHNVNVHGVRYAATFIM